MLLSRLLDVDEPCCSLRPCCPSHLTDPAADAAVRASRGHAVIEHQSMRETHQSISPVTRHSLVTTSCAGVGHLQSWSIVTQAGSSWLHYCAAARPVLSPYASSSMNWLWTHFSPHEDSIQHHVIPHPPASPSRSHMVFHTRLMPPVRPLPFLFSLLLLLVVATSNTNNFFSLPCTRRRGRGHAARVSSLHLSVRPPLHSLLAAQHRPRLPRRPGHRPLRPGLHLARLQRSHAPRHRHHRLSSAPLLLSLTSSQADCCSASVRASAPPSPPCSALWFKGSTLTFSVGFNQAFVQLAGSAAAFYLLPAAGQCSGSDVGHCRRVRHQLRSQRAVHPARLRLSRATGRTTSSSSRRRTSTR